MDQIIDRLWVGDANDGQNVEALRSARITAVLNATAETDSLSGQGLDYLRLNQADCQPIAKETLNEAIDWLFTRMDLGYRILVHCGAGVSRAPTFAIAYLMNVGFSWDEAEALVRSKRPQINPHPALKQSVLEHLRR